MAVPRETPFGAYNFLVEFDGNEPATSALGGFSDVSGLGTEITMMEYRQGNDKQNSVHKVSGLSKVTDVTLKRGITGVTSFWQWIAITRVDPTHRRTVKITLQDEQRNPVLTWMLFDTRPMKWTGPTFAAKGGSDVAMEELVLTAERIELATA
jgi:phage tail-like protein